MNKFVVPFFMCLCVVASAYAESLLKATSFPKTFEDLSFAQRVQFKADDYELYQPEYDDNGYCIKNCAYPGLNIKYELEKSENDTQQSVEHSQQYEQVTQHNANNQSGQQPNQQVQPVQQQTQNLPVNTQNIVSVVSGTGSSAASCINRSSAVPNGQKVPWGEPLIGKPRITSQYGPRRLEGKNSFHDGIDYAAVVGTAVYSPAEGKVVRVINDSRCGKGLRIQHPDGTQTIYCHLSEQLVATGDVVGAGCQIAKTGETGHVTGAHLHYGMRDASGNKINPSAYTKRAK